MGLNPVSFSWTDIIYSSLEPESLLHGTSDKLCSGNSSSWRRKWQPTPVFLPGESQGWGILVGCRLWGHSESDTTEVTQEQQPIRGQYCKELSFN